MYSEGVLFLRFIKVIKHFQAIELSSSEQSPNLSYTSLNNKCIIDIIQMDFEKFSI